MKWRDWLRSWLCFSSSFKSFGLFFGTIAIVKIQILMMPEAFASWKRENFFLRFIVWHSRWNCLCSCGILNGAFFIKLKSENPFGTRMNEKVICPVFMRSMRNANLTWRAWKRQPGELCRLQSFPLIPGMRTVKRFGICGYGSKAFSSCLPSVRLFLPPFFTMKIRLLLN